VNVNDERQKNFNQVEARGDEFTGETFEQVQSEVERLIGRVQEKYDLGREQATQEVQRLVNEYDAKLQAVKEKAVGRVEQKTAQSPWKVIALAVVVGFVMGLLFRPKNMCDETQ